MNLKKELIDAKCIKYGNFKLKSGRHSSVYFDIRSVVSFPSIYSFIIDELYSLISQYQFDYIVGVPVSGMLFAAPIAAKYNIKMLVVRKDIKDHGTKKEIEGNYLPGKRCLLIDDVITSGKSVLEVVEKLKNNGLIVTQTVVILDREADGKENLEKVGINVASILKMEQIILNKVSYSEKIRNADNYYNKKLLKVMMEKKTNLALAADLTNTQDILSIVEKVGKNICLLKLHTDTIIDFNEDFITLLLQMASKYSFLIMEDRKMADIGKIMKRQVESIAEWADFITVHGISGYLSIKSITDIGIVLVAEMSSKDNLITADYTQEVIDMADNIPDVSGFIIQSGQCNPKYINFTPGISINDSLDSHGQTYKTPRDAIIKGNTDVVIVGKDIYTSVDPEKCSEKYRKICWDTYWSKISVWN